MNKPCIGLAPEGAPIIGLLTVLSLCSAILDWWPVTLIALIAIVVPDIATAFKIGANAFGPVVAIPVLLSFFWKGVNDKATSIAMVLSVIVSVCLDIYFVYVVGVGAIGNMYAAALSLIINVFGSIYFNAKQKKAAA